MKTPVVVLVALTVSLAVGHLVEANNEPPPSVANDLMRMLFGEAKRRAMASPHIAGGSQVKPHSHPHQAALHITMVKGGRAGFCGGSLIAPQWVLTAAHCAPARSQINVTLGAHNMKRLEKERQTVKVKRVFLLDGGWNAEKEDDDIALLQLSKPATLNDKVKIIRLPSLRHAHKDLRKTSVEISGWGKYSDHTSEISLFLRSATTYVSDNKICNSVYGQITSEMICIDGSEGPNACSGDSGGPLTMTESDGVKTVIGVASFTSTEGCESRYPTVFTRVDQYLGWIANHTGIELRK